MLNSLEERLSQKSPNQEAAVAQVALTPFFFFWPHEQTKRTDRVLSVLGVC
jgi:hypothetical protein